MWHMILSPILFLNVGLDKKNFRFKAQNYVVQSGVLVAFQSPNFKALKISYINGRPLAFDKFETSTGTEYFSEYSGWMQ